MRKAEEYRDHARECRGLAAKTKAGEHRDALLKLAAAWDSLAEDREHQAPRSDDPKDPGED